jgi:hypothetical protein
MIEKHWTPVGVTLPDIPLSPEVMARLIRMTGGNFRLLTRLLTKSNGSSKSTSFN